MDKMEGKSPRGPHKVSKKLRGVQEWWESFFDDSYGRMGLEVIEEERTKKEVNFIVDALALKKSERILDLACGTGRHALELARRGFTGVTGLDYTEEYLEKAHAQKTAEDLNVRFLQGDMRDIPFENQFDACFNYFTSFGFFADPRDNEKVIASVAKALKPGGRFLLETIHRDQMVRNFVRQGWYERNGEYVLKKFDVDLTTSTLISTWTYIREGKATSREVKLRMYSLHEIIAMLERNRLKFVDVWGNKEKGPLTWDHHRMIIVARKPQ